MDFLSPERALIFRITHISNLPWILANGLHCRNSAISDPQFVEIGRPEIISRRNTRLVDVPPGGTLSDYVPFYFNSRTPMLYNIKTGWDGLTKRPMDDIAIMVTSLRDLSTAQVPFVFSDRNATLATAVFSSDLSLLPQLPWNLWQSDNFKRDYNQPSNFERYSAEALIHESMPAQTLKAIICYTEAKQAQVAKLVADCNLTTVVERRPGWYC
jgi:hypothetical protein